MSFQSSSFAGATPASQESHPQGRGLLDWLRAALLSQSAPATPVSAPETDSPPAVTRVEIANYLAQQVVPELRAAIPRLGRPGVLAVRCRFEGFCDDVRAGIERAMSDVPRLEVLSGWPTERDEIKASAHETSDALNAGRTRIFVLEHERTLKAAVPTLDHVLTLPRFDALSLAEACANFYDLTERPTIASEPWVAQVSPADLLIRSDVRGDPIPHIRDAVRRRLREQDCSTAQPLEALVGLTEVRGWVDAVIEDLRDALDPQVRCTWSQVERAVVFAGPAGVGKTSLSRAIARETGMNWHRVSARPWAAAVASQGHRHDGGRGAVRIAMEEDFDAARAVAPAILFIEDVRCLPIEAAPILGELISQVEPLDPLFVVVSCSDDELPDDAILRLAQIERTVYLPLPTSPLLARALRERLADVQHRLSDDEIGQVARLALGDTTADLDLYLRRALKTARRAGNRAVSFDDLAAAILGTPDLAARPKVSDDELRVTAYHEAGHAVMHFLGMREGREIQYATVVPRRLGNGTAMGFVLRASDEEHASLTKAGALAMIRMFLGGRAAEEILCGEEHMTTGSGGSTSSDLAKATSLASHLVGRCGFNQRGSLVYRSSPIEDDPLLRKEVDELLNDQYQQTSQLLRSHWHLVETVAKRLIEEQELSGDEVRAALHCAEAGRAIGR